MNPASATKVYSFPNAEFIKDSEPFIATNATVIGCVFFIVASEFISTSSLTNRRYEALFPNNNYVNKLKPKSCSLSTC